MGSICLRTETKQIIGLAEICDHSNLQNLILHRRAVVTGTWLLPTSHSTDPRSAAASMVIGEASWSTTALQRWRQPQSLHVNMECGRSAFVL